MHCAPINTLLMHRNHLREVLTSPLQFVEEESFLPKQNATIAIALPLYADNVLHTGEEIGIDNFEAMRSPTGKYRTTPLGGLFTREKGGFYHDGRYATLLDVVNHYNGHNRLNLSRKEKLTW